MLLLCFSNITAFLSPMNKPKLPESPPSLNAAHSSNLPAPPAHAFIAD